MKKFMKVLIGLIIMLVLAWIVVFFIDCKNCSNFELPVFAKESENEGNVTIYKGLGYKVEVEKYQNTITRIEMYIGNRFITGAVSEVEFFAEEELSYNYNFELNFHQRKDMGAKKIIAKSTSEDYDFDVYTVGGDVTVTVDGDMVYEFETALKENVVTIDQILNKAKTDSTYEICDEGMYSDGGTVEYQYEKYTIIKYNTLDGNIDFVIGPPGNVRNRIDDILYE